LKSSLQYELFALVFLVCIGAIWYATIIKKDYIVFTDEETVPAATDFFAPFLGTSDEETEEE